ncbi:hypothetical protein F0U62_21900 [Cystobacter fuscus]|uniref:hypothetical protein n=1 Tax=Cystobacter fuscus TaxID=43 RepID=UPI002B28D2A5|nr:hypothetical protein F0U62_21900 [Cystobacter fuscus]
MSPRGESNPGSVVLWTLLGVGYYILIDAAFWGLFYVVDSNFRSMVPLMIGLFVAPGLGYLMAVQGDDPVEKQDKRKGLLIALPLFYGLFCLAPIAICGGILLSGSKLH